MKTLDLIQVQYDYHMNNQGSTFSQSGIVKIGFMVALTGYEKTYKDFSIYNLIDFYQFNQKILRDNKNYYVGTWLNEDNNKVYVGIAICLKDKKEALNLAKNNKEIAIYDLVNNKEIRINYK